MPMAMKQREDVVTDGEAADDRRQRAGHEDNYFVVPKVVE